MSSIEQTCQCTEVINNSRNYLDTPLVWIHTIIVVKNCSTCKLPSKTARALNERIRTMGPQHFGEDNIIRAVATATTTHMAIPSPPSRTLQTEIMQTVITKPITAMVPLPAPAATVTTTTTAPTTRIVISSTGRLIRQPISHNHCHHYCPYPSHAHNSTCLFSRPLCTGSLCICCTC